MDRLDAMRLFIRVADAGSFSKAASDMGIGQPTVSRRIQDLEHRLGAELFQRTTRALNMTEAGQKFYERAGVILAEFDDAEAEARGLDHEPVGLLRISAANSLARRLIAPQIATFLDLYPHIKCDVIAEDTLTDLVEEGVDLAFRLGDLADSRLMAKRMGAVQRLIWASPAFLETHGTPESPEALASLPGLIFRQSPSSREWTLTRGDEQTTIKVDGRLSASSGEVLLQGALDGLGVFYAPDWLVCRDAMEGKLVRVLPEWTGSPLPVNAVWTSGKLRGKAKLFAEHMADCLRFTEPLCG
ncbi:MAG: LysR family transcriptional regulator [Pseudomonadota bacterium]